MPMRLRFECSTASTTVDITVSNLLNIIGVSNGGNGLVTLFRCMRLKKLELRGISSAVNKISTASIVFLGHNDSSKEITGSGNTEKPFHIIAKPDPRSLTSMWADASAAQAQLFRLTTDADLGEAQIDVWFDVVYYDDQTAHYVVTTAAGTANALYTTALDGVTGTPKWIPVGRGTIV